MSSAAEVHVWWAHTDQLTEAHLGLLDDEERRRLERLRRSDDRARFVLGSTVLRSLVAALDWADATDVSLDRTCPRCGAQHGPVTTPGRGWRCSVSHSGAFAVAAVVAAETTNLLGVDLETRCPADWTELVGDLLAPDEPAPVDEAGFLVTWARKEAVLKATREGLARSMATVDVGGASRPARLLGETSSLTLVDLDVTPLLRTGPAVAPLAAALAVGAEPPHVHWQRATV